MATTDVEALKAGGYWRTSYSDNVWYAINDKAGGRYTEITRHVAANGQVVWTALHGAYDPVKSPPLLTCAAALTWLALEGV